MIAECLESNKAYMEDVTVYRHVDCFDIMPGSIDKRQGVKFMGEVLNVSPKDMIAVGDGINDYSMFEYAGVAIGIHVKESGRVDKNFNTITEALEYISVYISG